MRIIALLTLMVLGEQGFAATLDLASLRLQAEPGASVRVSLLEAAAAEFRISHPLALQLLVDTGNSLWLSNTYSSVVVTGTVLRCRGSIATPVGSVFDFLDDYQAGPGEGTFKLERRVTVQKARRGDVGFLSRFSLSSSPSDAFGQHEFFVPGIWYKDSSNLPSHALAADATEEYFIYREDRMPLPLVMMRHPKTGVTLTLIRSDPAGSTCLADYTSERVVNSSIQVASLGVIRQGNPALALYYPASEGERSYLRPRSNRVGWVERFHPVQTNTQHHYNLLFEVSRQPGFPQAMRHAWRQAYEHMAPQTAKVDIAATYEASVQLIAHWSKTTRGAPGVPFRLRLPEGTLEDEEKINYQMGFVGQQLPLAYHLIRYGLVYTNETILQKGEVTVDFWASNCLTAEGLPRTWFNTWPKPQWRRNNTFLRVASDGMAGALMAYDVMAAAGRDKPEWLRFCRRFADWLVTHQNLDGSWYRAYKIDSTPADTDRQNTAHPIQYLVDLSKATGDRQYLEAALRAGDWCWTNVHQAFAYVGGTVDNPNVIDKEAGFLALGAFLALHDATGDARWLEAAKQAADFTGTWAYSWEVPIPIEDEKATYPRGATTTGFSLIACGHSGADLFLAGAPFYFYRLYLQTGENHYGVIARQLLYNTRQSVELDGALGYGYPGLCTEALSLAPPRGRGVNTWLPWLSYSMMEPVVRLQETYGVMDAPLLDEADRMKLLEMDKTYGRTRGLHTRGMRPIGN